MTSSNEAEGPDEIPQSPLSPELLEKLRKMIQTPASRNWAKDVREDEVLKPCIKKYGEEFAKGWEEEREAWAEVCARYNFQIHWTLLDSAKPRLPLREYSALLPPAPEILTPEERELKISVIKRRNDMIRRYLQHRVRAGIANFGSVRPSDKEKNPLLRMFARLQGVEEPKKALSALQMYQELHYQDDIKPVVDARYEELKKQNSKVKLDLNLRNSVSKELFNKLPLDMRAAYSTKAQDKKREEESEYDKVLNGSVERTPEFLSNCYSNIRGTIAPVHKKMEDLTLCKSVSVWVAPDIDNDGKMSTWVVQQGRTLGKGGKLLSEWMGKERWSAFVDNVTNWAEETFTAEERAMFSPKKPTSAGDVFDVPATDTAEDTHEGSLSSSSGRRARSASDAAADDAHSSKRARTASVDPGNAPTAQNGSAAKSTDGHTEPPRIESSPRPKSPPPLPPASAPSDSYARRPTDPKPKPQPYSPIDPNNPDGPLIPPKGNDYEQIKAFNVARNKRLIAEIGLSEAMEKLREVMTDATEEELAAAAKAKVERPKRPKATRASALANGERRRSSRLGGGEASAPVPDVNQADMDVDEEVPPPKAAALPEHGVDMDVDKADPPPISTTEHEQESQGNRLNPAVRAPGLVERDYGDVSDADRVDGSDEAKRNVDEPESLLPMCPSDTGEWFRFAYADIMKLGNLGPEFNRILAVWWSVENAYGFEESARGTKVTFMTEGERPPQIAEWIGGGRWRQRPPTFKSEVDFMDFTSMTYCWWSDNQNRLLKYKDREDFPSIDDSWETIEEHDWDMFMFPGRNGWLSVVAVLAWWGAHLKGKGKEDSLWMDMMAEATWVMEVVCKMELENGGS